MLASVAPIRRPPAENPWLNVKFPELGEKIPEAENSGGRGALSSKVKVLRLPFNFKSTIVTSAELDDAIPSIATNQNIKTITRAYLSVRDRGTVGVPSENLTQNLISAVASLLP